MYSVFSMCFLFMSLIMFSGTFFFLLSSSMIFVEWELMKVISLSVVMSLIFDWMSLLFLGVVCLISSVIMMYSIYYMEEEKNYLRFIYILVMFVLSMWGLIISPNLVSILLGWDGLGLSSYALVIFYQNESSCNAGMLTILSNRVGDVAILMSVGLLCINGDFNYIFFQKVDNLVLLMLCLAAMTKSAQVPFSAWLPAAMAAPTPVSALVHSSTLVTAGVYLLIRFNTPLMESGLNNFLAVVGCLTMLMAGLSANFEIDMKKVVALSTLSQLGLMVMTLSVGFPELAFFHLITHALFKSTLFMCVGFMIHSMSGTQDSRSMSGLALASPLMSVMFSTTNLALVGFPFLAGFYSKDLILEFFYSDWFNLGLVLGSSLATMLTMMYSMRVVYLSSSKNSVCGSVSGLSDTDFIVLKSMSLLFMGSILGGYMGAWGFSLSVSSPILKDSMKFLTIASLIVGVAMMGTVLINQALEFKKSPMKLMPFFKEMWFLSFLSSRSISSLSFFMGFFELKYMSLGWLENYGGQGGMFIFMAVSETNYKTIMLFLFGGFMTACFFMLGLLVFYIEMA
uniref:NADH-ubiquinone oxidoreductase chain 5 n=1 Tax=Onisimus nanseni TaxID=583350 RepID=D3G9L1_ONINA